MSVFVFVSVYHVSNGVDRCYFLENLSKWYFNTDFRSAKLSLIFCHSNYPIRQAEDEKMHSRAFARPKQPIIFNELISGGRATTTVHFLHTLYLAFVSLRLCVFFCIGQELLSFWNPYIFICLLTLMSRRNGLLV